MDSQRKGTSPLFYTPFDPSSRAAGIGDAFCRGCGSQVRPSPQVSAQFPRTELEQPTRLDVRCESCNTPFDSEADFCPACGARSGTAAEPESDSTWERLRNRLEEVTSGDYEIVGELGRGGMGLVFLARDPTLERHVAIKVLAPHLLADEQMMQRFQTEARIVAALKHPGIVSIHKFRHVEDLHFFVMDYVEGVPLRSVIRAHGPFPPEVVKAVVYDIGSAISYAHGRGGGVIYRDLKPGNIMLESSGSAVVTDFGISRAVGSQSGLTVAGAIIGTPEYMSPEQCRGGEVMPASDQYALGMVAYAMLVGAPPFSGQHYAVLGAHTSEEPPSLSDVRPDCPQDLADAVHRMIAKSPDDRWPDIRDALRAFGGRPHEEGDPLRKEVALLVSEVGDVIAPMMPVARIGVAGLPDPFEPGDTVSLEITPVDGLGRALSGREVAIVSREPRVATVGADGSVIAMAEGSAQLVIQCEKIESELALLVSSPAVPSLAIEAPSHDLQVGDEIPLVAVPLSRRGQALEGRVLEWASSDPRVAEVSRNGNVSAKAPGGVSITARCEGQVGSVELRIPTVPVVSVEVHGTPEGLYPGDRATLSAVAIGPSEQRLPDSRVAWSSAVSNIVRISPQGEVVALAPGEAHLVATSEGKVAEVSFTVLPSRVERVWFSVPVEYFSVGDRLKPDLTVMDGRSNLITDRVAQWESSSPDIVTVSAKGEMSALQVGTAEISVSVEGFSASVDVEVRKAETAQVVEPEPVRS